MSWIRVGLREYAAQWLVAALALVCLGLVSAVFAHYYPRRTRVATTIIQNGTLGSAACDDDRVLDEGACGRPCRTPYHLPSLDICLNTVAPSGTPCENACYAAGATCDADGACSSANPVDCRGHCTSDEDCATAIPLNAFWLTANATLDDERIFLNYQHVCYYNKCELFTLDRFWQAEIGNYGTAVGGYNRCDDYLDSAFVEERGGCLTQARYLLSPNLTNAAFYPPEFTATPGQFSMCLFYYDCANINQTAILKKRGAGAAGVNAHYSAFRRVNELSRTIASAVRSG